MIRAAVCRNESEYHPLTCLMKCSSLLLIPFMLFKVAWKTQGRQALDYL